jgi:hypothetical protein
MHVILRNSKLEVRFEYLENSCAEYTGVIGYWKEHFIRFKISME